MTLLEVEAKDLNIPLQKVVCVYCSQVMGWSGQKSVIRRGLVVTIEDNPNLPLTCESSPTGLHANMTPKQARARGFKV